MMLYNERAELILQQLQLQSTANFCRFRWTLSAAT